MPFLSYADRIKAKINELIDPETVSDADLAGMVAHYLMNVQPFGKLAMFTIDHDTRVDKGGKTGACPVIYHQASGGKVTGCFAHPEAAKPWIVAALCLGYRVERGEASLGTLEDIRARMRYHRRYKEGVRASQGAIDDEIPF